MLELERREHEIVLGSLYPPKTALRHEYLIRLRAPIRYAPSSRELDALARKAKRKGRWPTALVAQHEKKYGTEYKAALRARNALFFVELFERERVPHFHVHFANRAAHTAMFVKAISGIPFSMTAHGQDFLIDTCAELQKRGLNFDCEIIGEGALAEELEQRVSRQNLRERIHFAGEQSQDYVLTALHRCDIFVLASAPDERGASDIFPTVIAEAMATGKPVVSTTVAGIPELVANRETGLLAPPRDVRTLADAMEQLASDENLRANFGRAGRLRIEQKFTIEHTVEQLLERFGLVASTVRP